MNNLERDAAIDDLLARVKVLEGLAFGTPVAVDNPSAESEPSVPDPTQSSSATPESSSASTTDEKSSDGLSPNTSTEA